MQVKAVVSAAGLDSAENDDCASFAELDTGLCAWVIDGATSVAGQDYLGAGRGDPAWYAHALSKRLEANAARGLALAELHAAAARDVAGEYRKLCSQLRAATPLYAQPMAGLTMVRVSGDRVELYELGDCPAFALADGGGVRRLTTHEASEAADESHTRVTAAQQAVGYAPKAVWADRLPSLRQRREVQLTERPLQVSTPALDAVFGGYATSFELAGVSALVLMSDGFERFSVKYRLGDDAEMIRRSIEEGPDGPLAALRAAEAADPDCRRFPRLKPSDDATCVVIG